MMGRISYIWERFYPYVIAVTLCLVAYYKKVYVINNINFDSLIDDIVTMESIVIGLIGTIIPVVLSIKNESKFVKYVFENDKKGLFRKYLTSSIGIGLLSIASSLSLYVRTDFNEDLLKYVYYAWFLLVILFLLLTYRSMKYMIIIIFKPDEETEEYSNPVPSDKIESNRDKYALKD